MRIVGLTGGIASGKSTVSRQLQERGIPVVDADEISKEALKRGNEGYNRVVKAFGKGILRPDGEIDRAKFGDRIFADPEKRKKLDAVLRTAILRGIVWEVIKHWIAGTKVLVLDIPLLFETGMDKFMHFVIVVWVDPETQEERLVARNGLSKEQARNRMISQRSLEWKRERAHIVIDNTGTLEQTKVQVGRVVNQITGPSTWKELLHSRDFLGGLLALACIAGACKLWASRESAS